MENKAILSSQWKIRAKFEFFESAQDQEILNANIIGAKLFL